MSKTPLISKETGLLRGDGAKIARIHRCSPHHVYYVAKGVRNGSPALLDTIRKYQQRAQDVSAATAAA